MCQIFGKLKMLPQCFKKWVFAASAQKLHHKSQVFWIAKCKLVQARH
jgi:hypothetical protein